jgi:hypothetical protein
MNKRRLWPLIVLSSVCLATVAQAGTVSMQLTGAGNGYVLAGVYTSPYTGTINNGPPTSIICDDFVDDSFFNESWSATHTTVAALGSTRFDTVNGIGQANQQQDYDAAAALSIDLLALTDQTQIGYYSYAIWAIFNDQAVHNWLNDPSHQNTTAYDQAHQLALTALAGNYTSGQYKGVSFANVDIYTPIAGSATGCGSPCPADSPQEFMVVRAPEASSLAVLSVDLLTLLGVVVLFRRRSVQAAK